MFFPFSCHFCAFFFIDQPSFRAYFPLLAASVTSTLSQIGFWITVCPSSFQLCDPKQPDRRDEEDDSECNSFTLYFFMFPRCFVNSETLYSKHERMACKHTPPSVEITWCNRLRKRCHCLRRRLWKDGPIKSQLSHYQVATVSHMVIRFCKTLSSCENFELFGQV